MMSLSFTRKNKKGQSWYLDFILATTVMIIVSVIFVKLVLNFSESQDDLQGLTNEARALANTLLSAGYMDDISNPEFRAGLTNNDFKIDKNKLVLIANADYDRLKYILGINLDFYIVFQDRNNNFIELPDTKHGIGHPDIEDGEGTTGEGGDGVDTETELNNVLANINTAAGSVRNLAGLSRIIYYDENTQDNTPGDFVKMVVRVWK